MSKHEDNLRLMALARRRAQELRREDWEAYWSAGTRMARDRLRPAKRLAAAFARHVRSRRPVVEG
ncbi:hypothetical protein GCM10027034_46150 [Ramlibacter solisilvae]|uniref:Uncharacterized protein n=1 Tax=Ramlibacter tataouinensis TaxID=94132 RepID=A0A127JTX4_9BURK|nr:hypothetical protein [Ramlibacter tataouinensis]AMO23400.1 hypothetical protein UC35_11450 [Ramlibacter tataouinensis]